MTPPGGTAARALPEDDEAPERNRVLGWVRLAIVYLFVGALIWISRPTPALVALGGLLVLLGESARVWAAGHLLKSRELAVSGPYRYSQNPLYFGRLCILTGFCVMARLPKLGPLPEGWNLLVLAAGWAVFFFYYLPRKIRVEGTRLRKLHGGSWEEYFKSVPVLFPRFTPHGTNVRKWDKARFLRNREHWMISGVAIAMLLFTLRALLPA
jgi:protein-S-isoprenylcysteine O-methyltransferase Ste14